MVDENNIFDQRLMRKTGYVYEELYMWHDAGSISFNKWVEPGEIWENPATKRRIHGLLCTSGMVDNLIQIKARHASKDQITKFHTIEYHDRIFNESNRSGGDGGEQCRYSMIL
jgi:acetoin utilization deacetylase AcuC-like enzyme